jgi:hypothetical protein
LANRLGAGPPELVARARPPLVRGAPPASVLAWACTWSNLAAPLLRWYPEALTSAYGDGQGAELSPLGAASTWLMGAVAPAALEALPLAPHDVSPLLWGLCATEESLAALAGAGEAWPVEGAEAEEALQLALSLLGDPRARELSERRTERSGLPPGAQARRWFQAFLPAGA